MTRPLDGRAAIVTGAGRGIGRAIAESLAAAGARVIVADVGASLAGDGADPTRAREVAETIGKNAIAFTESVASPGVARQLVELAVKRFGGVDIVVNNAAIRRDAIVLDADPRDWDAVIRNNLSAPFHLVNAAAPAMRARPRSGGAANDAGRIINLVSPPGHCGSRGQSAYASAKAGLLALTQAAAMDLRDVRIAVNAVAPFACTRMTEAIEAGDETEQADKERILAIGAHHVANLVAALSTPAAANITGQFFGVRGREIFLFGPARLVARFEVETPEALAADLATRFDGQFTDMTADIEAFDTEPLV